jgi:ketosteroid isomerase-like protein
MNHAFRLASTCALLGLAFLPLTGCVFVAHDEHHAPRNDVAGLTAAKQAFLDAWTKREGETWTTAKLDQSIDGTEEFLSFDAMSQEKTVIRGHDAYTAIWGPGINGFATARLSETEAVRTWAQGDLGVTCSLVRVEGTQADGKKLDLLGHMTLAWKRGKSGWRVVHEHMSLGVKP